MNMCVLIITIIGVRPYTMHKYLQYATHTHTHTSCKLQPIYTPISVAIMFEFVGVFRSRARDRYALISAAASVASRHYGFSMEISAHHDATEQQHTHDAPN